jgi:hypothetical protein
MDRPEPTTDEPTDATIMEWADAGGCQATDGCWLPADQTECPHGHPSWAVVLGIEPEPAGE